MKYIVYISIIFLFLPKINIIGLHGGGIRLDDLFLFFLLFAIVLHVLIHITHINFLMKDRVYKSVFYILLLSFFSFLLNFNNLTIINIFYIIRLLEYSIFIYIGYYFYKYNFNLVKFITYYGLTTIFIVYLQYFNLIGGFVLGKYRSDVSDRPIGLTAGPWEVAMLLNIFIVFIFFNKDLKIKTLYIFFSIIAILLTGSRVALLSTIFVLFLLYYKIIFKNLLALITTVLITIILVMVLVNSSVYERSQSLFSYKNVEIIGDFYENIEPEKKFNLNNLGRHVNLNDKERDVSWMMRITKWIFLLKNTTLNIYTTIFGNGPGYYGNALDGSFIRIFGELGVAGLILYLIMIKELLINNILKYTIIALTINMLFIDIIYSYKTMSFIFLIYGYYYYKKNKEIQCLRYQ